MSDRKRWEELARRELGGRSPDELVWETPDGLRVKPLYSAADLEALEWTDTLPGLWPYLRGPRATMYANRPWTIRQYAGYSTAEDSNAFYRRNLAAGQQGLSVAFDLATHRGYDSDHPRVTGDVGKAGVAIDSVEDMKILFAGIPLDQVSVSMTINGPAIILFCFYVVAAEKQGIPPQELRGTVQNDILKEYMAQHAWIYPVEPALSLIVDMFEWTAKHAPKYNPISISGYHIREAGATAGQELAFTLRNGFEYVERGIARGLDVDSFAPRLSFFFDVHNDFFEEIAKFRAARRIWARRMRDGYGATREESWRLRTHAQTAGVSLVAQQPENNIVRVAYQAMAAVLGGTQSLHTNSMDETLALPTEKSVRIALRTQQVLAFESGVANTIDPLAGSWYVENLTDQLEREASVFFDEIDRYGGVVAGIEGGYFQREIALSAQRQQQAIEAGEHTIVGVNAFPEGNQDSPVDILKIGDEPEKRQRERLARLRASRDDRRVENALEALRSAAERGENVVEPMLECVRAYGTLFEIRHALERVHGAYREPISF